MKKILKKATEINQLDDYFVLNCYKCKSELYLKFIDSAGLFTVTCDQCKILCSLGTRPTKLQAVEAWNNMVSDGIDYKIILPVDPRFEPIEVPPSVLLNSTLNKDYSNDPEPEKWIPLTPGGKHLNELTRDNPEDVWWTLKEHYGTLYKSVEALRKAGYKVVQIPF